jgi:hypothetical protein
MRVRPLKGAEKAGAPDAASVVADLREGYRYVRATSWLWATLLFALAAVLFVVGPLEVLLPFAIRDNFGSGAEENGLALAAFGVGGAVGAIAISSERLPRRYLTVMILMWGLGSLTFAVVGMPARSGSCSPPSSWSGPPTRRPR